MSMHGSARITLCTPCADKRTIRRHESCEHRRHKLDGLDSLTMLLRKNRGIIRTLWACLTSVMPQRGKFADFAVLSADPLTAQQTKITDIVSEMTVVGGKIVYETPNQPP